MEFTNRTNKPIDSLRIQIGQISHLIREHDEEGNLYGELELPKESEKQAVHIMLYRELDSFLIQADSFSNFNADGTHEYLIEEDQAIYRFHP